MVMHFLLNFCFDFISSGLSIPRLWLDSSRTKIDILIVRIDIRLI